MNRAPQEASVPDAVRIPLVRFEPAHFMTISQSVPEAKPEKDYTALLYLPHLDMTECYVYPVDESSSEKPRILEVLALAPEEQNQQFAGLNLARHRKTAGIEENAQLVFVKLDKTIFHPQGGGQPTDVGKIVIQGGETVLDVIYVHWHAVVPRSKTEGYVYHVCVDRSGLSLSSDLVGSHTTLYVDADERRINARYHTAGHILDVAWSELEKPWALEFGTSYQFPGESYCEWVTGSAEEAKSLCANVKKELETKCNELLDASRQAPQIRVNYTDGVRNIEVPYSSKEKGFCVSACGGTHVPDVGAVGRIVIGELKQSKSNKKKIHVKFEVDNTSESIRLAEEAKAKNPLLKKQSLMCRSASG